MEVRVRKNPRLDPVFERGGYKLCYRAEYKHPDGKWYPCYDRRYNQSKRKAGQQARTYLAAHPQSPLTFRSTPTNDKGISFVLAGDV